MNYNGWTNHATWEASMEFGDDSYFQEKVKEAFEDAVGYCDMGKGVSVADIRAELAKVLDDACDKLAQEAEDMHDEYVRARVSGMTPEDAFEFGKDHADDDEIDYDEIVRTNMGDHTAVFATCELDGVTYSAVGTDEDEALDALCEALNDANNEHEFEAGEDMASVVDEENGVRLDVRMTEIAADCDKIAIPNSEPMMRSGL